MKTTKFYYRFKTYLSKRLRLLSPRITLKIQFREPHLIEQVPIKEQPFRKLKYSEMMEWNDQMLKDVGLNLPPRSSIHFKKSTDSQIDVSLIKKPDKSPHKRINDWNDHNSIHHPSFGHIHSTLNLHIYLMILQKDTSYILISSVVSSC